MNTKGQNERPIDSSQGQGLGQPTLHGAVPDRPPDRQGDQSYIYLLLLLSSLFVLHYYYILAIFYPFSQFCEIVASLPSLQNHQDQSSTYF